MLASKAEFLVNDIISSGCLGRSEVYPKLLNYLLVQYKLGAQPKEIDIAIHVFGRGEDFDSSQDSFVRVYVHNLRQKMDQYYDPKKASVLGDFRLSIPKGRYVFVVTDSARSSFDWIKRLMAKQWLQYAAIFLLSFLVIFYSLFNDQLDNSSAKISFMNNYPTKIVLGDYYLFGEFDDRGNIARLIRDFEINSPSDLDDLFMYNSELVERYYDVGLTYLPIGVAPAMLDVMNAFNFNSTNTEVITASSLQANDLLNSNIIYIGLFSGLTFLENIVFGVSSLELGQTYDELINKEDGTLYISQAASSLVTRGNYIDFGYISNFRGASDNQFLIIAGTRDEGLFQAARKLQDPLVKEVISDTINFNSQGTELLFQINGFANTSLGSELVMQSSVDASTLLN